MTIHTEQGFILTRHWSDTPQGIAVSYWLATENGPRKVTVAKQYAIGFVAQQNEVYYAQWLVIIAILIFVLWR